MKSYLEFNFSVLYWVQVAPFKGQPFKLSHLFRQMVHIGVRALPMVSLTALERDAAPAQRRGIFNWLPG